VPRIETLHDLITDLEGKSAAVASMSLAKRLPDSQLGEEVGVFANRDGEKALVLNAVDYLINTCSFDQKRVKAMIQGVLNENNFLGSVTELATYGWLQRHSLYFEPQVKFDHPAVLNPNGCELDGVLLAYDTGFDIKTLGLGLYLMEKLIRYFAGSTPPLKVGVNGRVDVDVKTVQKDALGNLGSIEAELRAGANVKIPSLNWTIFQKKTGGVQTFYRTWGPYRQAQELRYFPFKQAAQFTTSRPFMLILSYFPRLNPFLSENRAGYGEAFFRSLARRAFIQADEDRTPVSDHDDRVRVMSVGQASRLLSALMFVDLESERYHVFFNPRARNRIFPPIEDFVANSHPITDLASYDDFRYDNY